MQDSIQDLVRQFNEANPRFKTPPAPTLLDQAADKLGLDLLHEEVDELDDAMQSENIIEIGDALGDTVIVAYGEALKRGLNLDAIIHEQMRANMSKLVDGKAIVNGYDSEGVPVLMQDPTKPRGKILKGPNYIPPDLTKIIVF